MPRCRRHPLALFSLLPVNSRAEAVIAHPSNSRHVSVDHERGLAIDVGFHIRSDTFSTVSTTLATLGRGAEDITVNFLPTQCSFEIDLETHVVMLYGRSHGLTTQVFGDNTTPCIPFVHGRPRQVVVRKGLNSIVGMGGKNQDLVLFKLEWHEDSFDTIRQMQSQGQILKGCKYRDEDPRFDPTPETGTDLQPMRYATMGCIGSGQFGEVHKAVNVDTGKLMALKRLRMPMADRQEERAMLYGNLKREVTNLSEVHHVSLSLFASFSQSSLPKPKPHIVDFITSQGWEGTNFEIFMGLKDGNLAALTQLNQAPDTHLAKIVFHQMLQALDCLAMKNIVHRDIKPENILYVKIPGGGYHFQLGDFGLSNRDYCPTTVAGSLLYMAPELWQKREQSHKVDVWSLFVTMLWTLNTGTFRWKSQMHRDFENPVDIILSTANEAQELSAIQEMCRRDHEERASAAQMLVKCFDGQGLSTPRNRIPAMHQYRSSQ